MSDNIINFFSDNFYNEKCVDWCQIKFDDYLLLQKSRLLLSTEHLLSSLTRYTFGRIGHFKSSKC